MRVEFLSPFRAEAVGEEEWLLIEDFRVSIDDHIITVPKGFVTDLDSVPRLPLAYLLVKGRARRSAVLHDWLYAVQAPRAWADEAIYAATIAEWGEPESKLKAALHELTRKLIWAGVRVGGWWSYNRKPEPAEPFTPPPAF